MNLKESIEAEPHTLKGPKCHVAVMRGKMSPEDQRLLDGLFDEAREGERTRASIARILTRVGFPTTGERLANHARGECKCARG